MKKLIATLAAATWLMAAGAAVADGRVYVLDYDVENKADAMRCLSLADGREIWKFVCPHRHGSDDQRASTVRIQRLDSALVERLIQAHADHSNLDR